MAEEWVYQVRGLHKRYGAREVLAVDHLEVRRGEIFAVVGPSGAGKSTLLRLLDFLEPPSAGRITFLGHTINGNAVPLALRRRVTTVFQRPILLDTSAWDNVAYGLKIRGENRVEARVSETLERVGLTNLARQKAKTLSAGEAQRVALARALVIEPEALLLDEPTANLDPYNVGLIERIITDHNRTRGTTIVLVTHNVFQAKRLAHRAALLLDGRIIEVADAETFFERPRDPRTAAFVRGEMVY